MPLQRRPPTHRRQSPEQLRKRLCKYVSATHGGLTPAALGCRRDVAPRLCVSPLQVRFPSHGGLTAAAPAACAFVHRKSRNSAGKRSRRDLQERGGRKPPVVTRTRLQRRPPTRRRSAVCRTIAVAHLQVRLPSHGGLTPAAPGARRFFGAEKATFALYKRIFARTRAVAVSPPWLHGRDCNGVRQHAGRQSAEQSR